LERAFVVGGGTTLAAVEAAIIAAEVGVTEGVLVGAEGTEVRIVSGGVVVGAGTASAVGEAVGGVSGAVCAAGFEAVVVGEVDDGRRLSDGRRWGWRWGIVVSAAEARGEDYGSCGRESETCRFHKINLLNYLVRLRDEVTQG
jgi:hypothetical protein